MAQGRTRHRSTLDIDATGRTFYSLSGGSGPVNTFHYRKLGSESMTDQKNGWPYATRYMQDVGGLMIQVKRHWSYSGEANLSSRSEQNPRYFRQGALFPIHPDLADPPPHQPADSNTMIGLGTAGFKKTIPTKPMSSAAEFVGEMRQLPSANLGMLIPGMKPGGIPKFKAVPQLGPNFAPDLQRMAHKAAQFRKLAKNGGGAYLNVQFGWLPFIRGISDMMETHGKAAKIAQQFGRDNGKIVRRRTSLGSTQDVTRTRGNAGLPVPAGATPIWAQQGWLYTETTLTTRSWFSASYTYFVPGLSEYPQAHLAAGEAIRNKLYGTRITPELLWNLSPWTWLADYGGNIGPILSNLSRFSSDNLVCHHAYAMRETVAERVWYRDAKAYNGNAACFLKCRTVTKQRARGNPYGFSADWSPSGKQSAILAALAASRI